MRSVLKSFTIMVIGLFLFAGTAQAKQEYSGFLVDYSQLKPGPKGGVAKVYRKEGVDYKKYSKILMDHVVFYFKDDAEEKGIDPLEMAELSHKFHKEAKAALQGVLSPGGCAGARCYAGTGRHNRPGAAQKKSQKHHDRQGTGGG